MDKRLRPTSPMGLPRSSTLRWGIAALMLPLVVPAARRLLRRATNLSGKVVFITGGSRGLGLELARAYAGKGCRIAICARNEDELARARTELEGLGAEVLALPCDVGERSRVQRVIANVERQWGGIDVLVNNAGVIEVGPLDTMTLADFEEAMQVMYWGTVYVVMAALPSMQARGSGRIVNITSIGGKVSVPHLLPYSAAKFAAVGFSQGLAAELAGTGITVTTIVPGLMRTGSHLNAWFKGRQSGEYTWFSLGATLPLISMDAARAARQVVDAAAHGDRERTLSVPATLAAFLHGLAPATITRLLGITNRLLPASDAAPSNMLHSHRNGGAASSTIRVRGREVQQHIDSSLLDRLTAMGAAAADRNNQR